MERSLTTLLRHTLLAMTALLLAPPSAAPASEKIPVGVILTGDLPYYREIHESFVQGLEAESYGPDVVELILQKPVPNRMSWTNAVRKLVTFDAKIIIAYGGPATLTAVCEASGIPVVFAAVYEPEELGVSLKNATGISAEVPVLGILKKLGAIVSYSQLGIVYSSSEKDTVLQARRAQELAETLNFESQLIDLTRKKGRLDLSGLDGIFMTTSCAGMRCVDDIVGLAREAKIPTAACIGGAGDRGVLLTLSANTEEQGRVASAMAVEVLKGISPSEIAPRKATKVEFVVNLREADNLGLKIPFDLLTTATRAIK